MCFTYFKMNLFERNPEKYIRKKCDFLFARGYSLKIFHRNSEYCFNFYIKSVNNDYEDNHIYFHYENEYVDCSFSNINTTEVNLKTLNIKYPVSFDLLTNMEKIDFFVECVKNNIELIDIRAKSKLQQALDLSREKRHLDAYPIYEELYKNDKNATNTFNLFQCAVYCGEKEVEEKLYNKLKNYSPNLKKEPMELSGCFVRFYYGLILCEVNRNDEAIEIIDYLIYVVSHYSITDPTFLFVRGIPSVQMIYELIKVVFKEHKEKLLEYKNKLLSVADENTKKFEFVD